MGTPRLGKSGPEPFQESGSPLDSCFHRCNVTLVQPRRVFGRKMVVARKQLWKSKSVDGQQPFDLADFFFNRNVGIRAQSEVRDPKAEGIMTPATGAKVIGGTSLQVALTMGAG